ncbi:MAG: hypothetical protein J6A36_02335 [Clostridia bacterium]|nr:hypothetical protein [Clostridia bacterium]
MKRIFKNRLAIAIVCIMAVACCFTNSSVNAYAAERALVGNGVSYSSNSAGTKQFTFEVNQWFGQGRIYVRALSQTNPNANVYFEIYRGTTQLWVDTIKMDAADHSLLLTGPVITGTYTVVVHFPANAAPAQFAASVEY